MEKPITYFCTNIGGLTNVLEELMSHKVKKIIFPLQLLFMEKAKLFQLMKRRNKKRTM